MRPNSFIIYVLWQEENFSAKKGKSVKVNKAKKNDIAPISLPNKKIKLNMGEGIKVVINFNLFHHSLYSPHRQTL